MPGLNYGSTKTLRKWVKSQIKDALLAKDGAAVKFKLDLIKLNYPAYFNDCVADVLNEFGRKNMINFDGPTGPTLRSEPSQS